MTSNTSTKNGAAESESEVEFEFDIEEARVALGVAALEEEVNELRFLLGEALTYTNYVDLALQELRGEGVVTEDLKYNVRRGGRIEVQRVRPPAPANLTRTKLSLASKKQEG